MPETQQLDFTPIEHSLGGPLTPAQREHLTTIVNNYRAMEQAGARTTHGALRRITKTVFRHARALDAALARWRETNRIGAELLEDDGVNIDDFREHLRAVAASARRQQGWMGQARRGRPPAFMLKCCVEAVWDGVDPDGRKGAACYYDAMRDGYAGWLFTAMRSLLDQAGWTYSQHTLAAAIKHVVRARASETPPDDRISLFDSQGHLTGFFDPADPCVQIRDNVLEIFRHPPSSDGKGPRPRPMVRIVRRIVRDRTGATRRVPF